MPSDERYRAIAVCLGIVHGLEGRRLIDPFDGSPSLLGDRGSHADRDGGGK